MKRTEAIAVRLTAVFLLAAVCFTQWAGLSKIEKYVKGLPSSIAPVVVAQIDGPLPPPPPPTKGQGNG